MEKTVITLSKKNQLIIFASVCALVVSLAEPYIVIPVSESVKPAVLIKLHEVIPTRGDYVTFELRNEKLPEGKAFLTKKIACLPGDYLDSRDGAFFCNNHLIATALKTDGYKRPLSWYKFKGYIPKDMVFVVGDDPRSYDSRYWGFIPFNTVTYSWPVF